MKLLFVTQVLDGEDAILGFVPRWVRGLAAEVERVRVIALEVGDTSALPDNVDVRVLGRKGRVRRWLRFRGFLREAFAQDGFDVALTHMVPRYALHTAGPARAHGARVYLWYTHGGVDGRLRRAERLVEKIFTATPESMRLETPKRVVTGHGIDLGHFDVEDAPAEPPRLMSVGRLTPSKDPLTVVEALARLVEEGRDVELDWLGGGLTAADGPFGEQVRGRIAERGLEGRVHLHGPVPYRAIAEHYGRAAICINASSTGSLDKVVLEAMAARRIVLSSNDGFDALTAPLGAESAQLCFTHGDADELAQRVAFWLDREADERAAFGERLRNEIAAKHEVDVLMSRLVRAMERGA